MYITAFIDVNSRKIVGWVFSNTMSPQCCKNVLGKAIAIHGKPEIVNSDQGSQYTSALWMQFLEQQGISISMDGKNRAWGNLWIKRFWKSLKYDYIYLNPVDMVLNSIVEFKTTSTITIRKRIIPLSKHPTNDMKNP